jgi:hypothetical protein
MIPVGHERPLAESGHVFWRKGDLPREPELVQRRAATQMRAELSDAIVHEHRDVEDTRDGVNGVDETERNPTGEAHVLGPVVGLAKSGDSAFLEGGLKIVKDRPQTSLP